MSLPKAWNAELEAGSFFVIWKHVSTVQWLAITNCVRKKKECLEKSSPPFIALPLTPPSRWGQFLKVSHPQSQSGVPRRIFVRKTLHFCWRTMDMFEMFATVLYVRLRNDLQFCKQRFRLYTSKLMLYNYSNFDDLLVSLLRLQYKKCNQTVLLFNERSPDWIV